MNLLAIETATEACSVALLVAGDVRERFEIAPRRHTELVLPWCDELLAEAGIGKAALDAIAVGRGPGAFTGVRLAIALVQGLALALDRPVLPVSTLAALALRARLPLPGTPGGLGSETPGRVVAAIDARMGEIYHGLFAPDADGLVEAASEEQLSMPTQVRVLERHPMLYGVGSGFAADNGALVLTLGQALRRHDAAELPHAGAIARLAARAYARGEAISADLLEPAYLRDKVAQTLVEQGKA